MHILILAFIILVFNITYAIIIIPDKEFMTINYEVPAGNGLIWFRFRIHSLSLNLKVGQAAVGYCNLASGRGEANYVMAGNIRKMGSHCKLKLQVNLKAASKFT